MMADAAAPTRGLVEPRSSPIEAEILIAGSAARAEAGTPRRSSRVRDDAGVIALERTSTTCNAAIARHEVARTSSHQADGRDVRGSLHMKRVSTPTISCRLVTVNPKCW